VFEGVGYILNGLKNHTELKVLEITDCNFKNCEDIFVDFITETKSSQFKKFDLSNNNLSGNDVLGILKAYKEKTNLIIQNFDLVQQYTQITQYDPKQSIHTWIQVTKKKYIIGENELNLGNELIIEARSTKPNAGLNYIAINGYGGRSIYIVFTDHGNLNEMLINEIKTELKKESIKEQFEFLLTSKLYLKDQIKYVEK
jgi:hypothetical protein